MKKRKLISFDLDGTLVDPTYNMFVWEIGVPQLYAEKHHISLSEAVSTVKAQYEKVGDAALEWYNITYWFECFELPGSWEDLMGKYRGKIRAFPEAKGVLKDLMSCYDLIVTSNAAREFVEIELKETGFQGFFTRVFSATSDFGQVKKTPQFYEQLCNIMGENPSDVIHVGDHYKFDYIVPKELGIKAYYLDRDGKNPKDDSTVKDLRDFARLVNNAA
ncbi:MAG TPA: HAD family hydrolase [Desulfatiglandales bacterium]|nr:HAD family hydrolase [Desulfatiglandales bacterium]